MNEHILKLLTQRQYSEEVKDEAILRVLFNGESTIIFPGNQFIGHFAPERGVTIIGIRR